MEQKHINVIRTCLKRARVCSDEKLKDEIEETLTAFDNIINPTNGKINNNDLVNALRTMSKELNQPNLSKEIKLAFEISIKAIQKQIPKKPIKEKWLATSCPTCASSLSISLGDGYYKDSEKEFCDCGQRLEWD